MPDFTPPPNVVHQLELIGASQRDIDLIRGEFSEGAIKKALKVLEGTPHIKHKFPYLRKILHSNLPKKATVTPILPNLDEGKLKQWEDNSKTMLDLSMASKEKLERIRHLLKANINNKEAFPLPEVTVERMLKEIDNDNNLINPRVVLAVRMLLKYLGKRFEENF